MKRRGDSTGAVDEVEADFGDDTRLARRWKRRHMTAKIGRVEKYSSRNSKKARSSLNNKNSLVISELVTAVEEDYLIYLNDLTQLSKFNGDDHPVAPILNNVDVDHDGYGDDEDNGGGVTDPEYAMFLDNVKEVGKSYMLEYVMADGKQLLVKYEDEDGSKTGNHFRCFEANGFENKENNVRRQNLSKHSKKYGFKDSTHVPIGKMDTNNNQRVLRSDLRREERENQTEVFKSSALERKNAEKLKKIVGGDSRRVKMEIPRRTLRSDSKKETDKNSSVLRDTVKKETIETGRRTLENMSKKESMRNEEKLRNARTKGKGRPEVVKNVEVKEEGPVIAPKRKRGRPKKIPDTKAAHSVKRRCTHTVKSDFVDEVYQEYLTYYKHEGRFLVYAPEGGKRVVYERDSDSDSDSDSEVLILENDPFLDGDHTPLLIDLAGDGDNTVISGSKDSQYRKKLMEILQQPFDETEYENLSKEASCRRPMEQERNLRGRIVACRLKGLGKSYLAQFTDFAKKLKQVRHDRIRRLNLLRGFFYYLEHASHEGKFKPWNDPSCSSILPPVSPTQIKAKCEV